MFPRSARPGHRRHVPVAAAGFALMAAMVGPLVPPATAGSLPTVRSGPAAVTDSQAVAGLATRSVAWKPCRDGFQCATVRAPLDYDNPGGATVSLSVIRRPAATRSERIGSLMVNPGGPGVSGVDFVRDLVTLRTPAAGKVCRPEGSPFGPDAAVSGSSAAAVIAAATLPEAVRRALLRG